MKQRKRLRKIGSLLLALALLFSAMPMGLIAEEITEAVSDSIEEESGDEDTSEAEVTGSDPKEADSGNEESAPDDSETEEEPDTSSETEEADYGEESVTEEASAEEPEESNESDEGESPDEETFEPAVSSEENEPEEETQEAEETVSPEETREPEKMSSSEEKTEETSESEETDSSEAAPDPDKSASSEVTPDPEEQTDETVFPETTPSAEEQTEETPALDATEEPQEEEPGLIDTLREYGYAYLSTQGETAVYSTEECAEADQFYTITQEGIPLLVTETADDWVRVWFVSDDQFVSGHVLLSDFDETPLTLEEVESLSGELPCETMDVEYFGELLVFEAEGSAVTAEPEDTTVLPAVGSLVRVNSETRVFTEVDPSASSSYIGDYWNGIFVSEADVLVKAVSEDSLHRAWLQVEYLYGPQEPSGVYGCTMQATVWVLADETGAAEDEERDYTDYAFDYVPELPMLLSFTATSMSGFSLKDHSGGITDFEVGETDLHATTGHDNEYPQLCKSADYGTIYATPHYMGGSTMYCLEHTMDSPAVRDNPDGPYEIVDIEGYEDEPGYSGIIFSEPTLHAIGWIIRHSWPFMVLNRTDTYNNQWTRVAGQFAIREVIKQIEGDEYVRDYWEMDDFYATSTGAPAVYLKYAKWLAENAVERASITGKITASSKSVTQSGTTYKGKVTLKTDADLLRIYKASGISISGNSGGSDSTYYYAESGDTITVTAKKVPFSIKVESASDEDEEANFVIAIPDADIQKGIIPQSGLPNAMKTMTIKFELPAGSVKVQKMDIDDGTPLAGAVFQLLSGTTVKSELTTGTDGTVTFSNLSAGTYTVREKTAPEGYSLSTATQSVTVTAGNTSTVTFFDSIISGIIRIVKTDSLTGDPVKGAVFTVTCLSPSSRKGNKVTLTTDSSGKAETELLLWGSYQVEETGVPDGYAGAVSQTVTIQ